MENKIETHNTREWEKDWRAYEGRGIILHEIEFIHHHLQKAREEERERIEAIFKEHVPPHAMNLEDGVWLKRLLNKAFKHDNNNSL